MEAPEAKKPSNAVTYTILGCLLIMTLGTVVAWNYLVLSHQQRTKGRLPMIQPLEKDLLATNQFGEKTSWKQLRGKVWVAAFVYTRCRAGCLGVVAELKKLHEEKANDPEFHIVSVSIEPEHDTAPYLAEWTKQNGVGGKDWWFLTGEGDEIRAHMSRYFKLFLTKRENPEEAKTLGEWEHSFHVALVDKQGVIRNLYNLMDINTGDQAWANLRRDIETLKKEK